MGRKALIGENSCEYISILLDIWNNHDCAVLLDWRIPPDTLIDMMEEANVETCYIQDKYFDEKIYAIVPEIEFIAYSKSSNLAEILPPNTYNKFHADYTGNEAVIIYSSGTTGKSKGIILSHYALNKNADAIIDYMAPSNNDCIYVAKTISHASTITGEVLVALKTRTKIVIAPIIVPPRYTLSNISKYKATIICINPTLLKMYIEEYCKNNDKYDLSCLREIYVHGAKNDSKTCEVAKHLFNWVDIYYEYGLSEAGPRVTTQKISSCSLDSAGAPLKNVSIKVITDTGKIAMPNEYGAIHVSSPSLFSGYVSGTAKFPSLYQGWLNTGDVGFVDEYNELHILGRIDDVIIIDAHKIYPSDVEKQIINHSNIKECVVVKIEKNKRNVLGCLYVSDETIDSSIKKKLINKLMPFEIPKVFVKIEALPKTLTGKISKKDAEKLLEAILAEGEND